MLPWEVYVMTSSEPGVGDVSRETSPVVDDLVLLRAVAECVCDQGRAVRAADVGKRLGVGVRPRRLGQRLAHLRRLGLVSGGQSRVAGENGVTVYEPTPVGRQVLETLLHAHNATDQDAEVRMTAASSAPDGLTTAELEAWNLLAAAATRIMSLPSQHPMEREEYAHAIHVLQRCLLARPAVRDFDDVLDAVVGEEEPHYVWHPCAVPSCGRDIANGEILCGQHWKRIPRALQQEVDATWHAYRANPALRGDYEHVRGRVIAVASQV